MGGKVKKKVSSQSQYGKPSLKHKIGMAVTGAGPITTTLNKVETKIREKASKTATSVANKLGVPKSVRKVASKVATGIGTVTAGARLASRVLNPLFVPQMVAKQALGLGVTVPGSKYIGPKNPMNLGKPVNAADKAAYEHDQAYDKYIKSGIPASQVYGSYSKADAKLMKAADTTTPEGLAAYLGMASKKLFQKKLNE